MSYDSKILNLNKDPRIVGIRLSDIAIDGFLFKDANKKYIDTENLKESKHLTSVGFFETNWMF